MGMDKTEKGKLNDQIIRLFNKQLSTIPSGKTRLNSQNLHLDPAGQAARHDCEYGYGCRFARGRETVHCMV